MGVVTGTFALPNGTAVGNGAYQWKLSGDAIQYVIPRCDAPRLFSGSLDTNGNMTATFDFNDVLSTNTGLTTYYQLTIKDSGGGQVWNEFYYLTGTSANLNLIPPLGNPPGTVPLTVTAVTTTSGGGVLGKWPGNWVGCIDVSGVASVPGSNIGIALAATGSTNTPGAATAANGPYWRTQSNSIVTAGGYADGSSFQPLTLGYVADWFTKIAIVGTTFSRYWFGMCDQSITQFATSMNSDTPTANFVGFRYASDVDGTTYHAVCQTSGAAQTVVNTGISVAASAIHVLEIVPTVGGTVIKFYIDLVLVATISTNVPATSVLLNNLFSTDAYNNAGSNFNFDFYYVWMLLSY
jgi:hypothetical protein